MAGIQVVEEGRKCQFAGAVGGLISGRFLQSCQQDIKVSDRTQAPGQPLQFGLELFPKSAVDHVF